MMTSFAFIFGLFPLVIATGAGALSRRAVGTPVFGGMIAASLVGIFVIPMLYVTFQWLRERSGRRAPRAKAPAGTTDPVPRGSRSRNLDKLIVLRGAAGRLVLRRRNHRTPCL